MKNVRTSFSWMLVAPVVIVMVLVMTVLAPAQGADNHAGVVKDWSTHHVRYSNPGTAGEAIRNGTYDRWLRIVTDSRYIMQQRERITVPEFMTAPHSADDSGVGSGEGPEEPNNVQGSIDLAPASVGDHGDAAQFPGGVLPRGLGKALIAPPSLPAGLGSDVVSQPFLNHLKKDWSETQGLNGTTGLGEFPATYTTGGTSCSDFAIFNTGLAASSSQANVIAFNNLYASCPGSPTTYWAYNTGATATSPTSVALSVDGTQIALVQNVPDPVAATGTATANLGTIPAANSTITVGTTTYTWVTTASITTVNQMSTSGITLETEIAQTFYAVLTGSRANCPSSNTACISASQTPNASVTESIAGEIVTLTASCGGGVGTCGNTVPFSQTGSTGMTLSPTGGFLSGGSGTSGVGGATLVLVRMGAGGTLTSPHTPTSEPTTSYFGCPAPCMTSIQLSGSLISTTTGPMDTYSSPFYDSNSDTIYVGDDSGGLHKITGVFRGSLPAETISSGHWPTAVSSNASLGGPVYDPGSTHVFVGDYLFSPPSACATYFPPGLCGYLYSVNSSTGAIIATSAQLDYSFGIVDAPLLDPSEGEVYAFAGADNSTSCSSGPCSAVYQFPVGFASNASGTKAQVGAGYDTVIKGQLRQHLLFFWDRKPFCSGGNRPREQHSVPDTDYCRRDGHVERRRPGHGCQLHEWLLRRRLAGDGVLQHQQRQPRLHFPGRAGIRHGYRRSHPLPESKREHRLRYGVRRHQRDDHQQHEGHRCATGVRRYQWDRSG